MMAYKRKGMGKGKGKGYKNMTGKDPMVHSQSSKGIKQPQRIRRMPQEKSNWYKSSFGDNPKYNFDAWRLETGFPLMAGIKTNVVGRTPKTAPFGQQNTRKKPYSAWFGVQTGDGGFEKRIVREFQFFDDAKKWVEKKVKSEGETQ